ncbi:MAG TPA: hypothetical protein VNJ08_01730 [Bacteriovoracaceae bacterium]|nr:hypothetical protein [Bacteriovoracaceae bacterium]
MIARILSLWKSSREKVTYHYPLDENEFEQDPTKVRTSEMSQFQDEARDIESRGTERDAYENKSAQDS